MIFELPFGNVFSQLPVKYKHCLINHFSRFPLLVAVAEFQFRELLRIVGPGRFDGHFCLDGIFHFVLTSVTDA